MSQTNSALTKVCSSCGLQKPLSAFLQLSGLKGAIYGNICSSCRKTHLDKINSEPTEDTSSTSGVKIDSKVKVQADTDKKKQYQLEEELYHEERDKAEEKQTQQTIKIEKITKDEKKHRQDFLSKTSFLDNMGKKIKSGVDTSSSEYKEELEKQIDLSAPFQDTQIAGKQKYSSEFLKVKTQMGGEFLKVKTWLGGNSLIVQQAERVLQNAKQKENQEKKSEDPERTINPSKRK